MLYSTPHRTALLCYTVRQGERGGSGVWRMGERRSRKEEREKGGEGSRMRDRERERG